ncbi:MULTISPECIES: hypothetical protein [Sinorhizobium]|uniref:PhnA-like protein n=2 Tax=Sinorhizobium TaxID=28105 RepID=A0A2S3YV40_9HYPH|nr:MULTISPECIES: hypothetical protein [Sinorhizobium]ASY60488.1 hypothetical protein SS05631_b63960 [Sinorhizobium sp. CCBAU 05631]AUX80671.1 hypothetical protein NXT3_PC01524 [Sinorhizobium fredii]PDT39583.1 PhnA-like protein [Sinorhizobium sp. FG01]PDT51343.1 PhnA-like protein [Sinorhizobium sp. NG07B]POH25995.1 PhnA-like protein [Sinorhizobium americanum]
MSDPLYTSPATAPAESLVAIAPSKLDWAAIFAGVALALAVQLLLNLLGVGLGAAAFDPGSGDNPGPGTFSIASGIWFALSGIISAFAGGYLASRLSGRSGTTTGAYHGLTTWAVTTLIVVYLLTTSVGALLGGALSGLSSVVGGAGRTVATVATTAAPALSGADDPFADIEGQIRETIGGDDPAAMRDAAVASIRALVTGDETQAEEARNRAADALARAQNIPPDQARARVQEYEQTYRSAVEDARRKASDAADTAATVVSSGAFLGFFSLLLGAAAAWLGGWYGTRRLDGLTDVS